MIQKIKKYVDTVKKYHAELKGNSLKLFSLALIFHGMVVLSPAIQKNLMESLTHAAIDHRAILYYIGVALCLAICTVLEVFLLIQMKLTLQKKFTLTMLHSMLRSENKIIQKRGAGAYLSRIFGDAEQMSNLYGENIFTGFISVFSSIVIFIIATRWTPLFAYVTIPTTILIIIVMIGTNQLQMKYFALAREKIYELNPCALELIENRKTMMGNLSNTMAFSSIKETMEERDRMFYKSSLAATLGNTLIRVIKDLSFVCFFIFSMNEILRGKLDIATFIPLMAYLNFFYAPVGEWKEWQERLSKFDFFSKRNEENFMLKQHYTLPENHSIRLAGVSVKRGEKTILSDFHLTLDQVYGVVGLSGEGKSTLIKALLKEIEDYEGHIEIGGKDAREIPLPIVHGFFNTSFQEAEIFDGDLNYNVTLGRTGLDDMTYDQKQKALEEKIGAELGRLEKGESILDRDLFLEIYHLEPYEWTDEMEAQCRSHLGNVESTAREMAKILMTKKYYKMSRYEYILEALHLHPLEEREFGQRGSHISGGEKNKVALARFYLKEDFPFIMDEPFTSLDEKSEKENLAILSSMVRGGRGLVISHKLNILRELSDEIIVIHGGRVEAVGTHEELLSRSKLYGELYQMYREKRK